MTKQKSFKGRVRARMDKTSESYTTARRQLLAKSGTGPGPEPGPEPGSELAAEVQLPFSDQAIQANTGRPWDEWFALLDAWGGAERPHPEIARWLVEEHGVPGWWAQGVTVGYERARGLRAPGQRRGGLFEATASKTVAVPVGRLYEAFTEPALRERWLPGATVEIRRAQPAKSVRAGWEDGSTRLVVWFSDRGDAKSQVALAHQLIPDAGTADKLKAFWRERLADLKQLLEA
jgi:hypothetical protein